MEFDRPEYDGKLLVTGIYDLTQKNEGNDEKPYSSYLCFCPDPDVTNYDDHTEALCFERCSFKET